MKQKEKQCWSLKVAFKKKSKFKFLSNLSCSRVGVMSWQNSSPHLALKHTMHGASVARRWQL